MGNPLDTLLAIGASFDYVTPILSVLRDLMEGAHHTFLIPYDSSPLSGREIDIMLSRRGIKSWGHMVVAGTLMVSVCEADARQAQNALQNHGVPLENEMPQSKTTAPKANSQALQQAQPKGGWWQCSHCHNWYKEWKTKCPSCGAPLQPGK